LAAYKKRRCYQVRGLTLAARRDIPHHGVVDARNDYSEWLDNWEQLTALTQ
jgi:hypothetical protein